MYVYLQAYEQGAANTEPLIAFVTFYHGQSKAFQTQPEEVVQDLNNRLKTMPLTFEISLSELPPAEYECQVTVLNPNGQKSAFWRAPVKLVQ